MASDPLPVVLATALTYTSVLTGSQSLDLDHSAASKLVSSLHSVVSSAGAIYALRQPWQVPLRPSSISSTAYLDDRLNPLIFGHSRLGNAITSCETGYLLYETIRKVTRYHQKGSWPVNALSRALRKEPLMMTHHICLLIALGILQVYIANEHERGIWIIVAFEIMNFSTPFLHLRWLNRKRTSKDDWRLDALLGVVFAISRLGTILWIVKEYAAFHEMASMEAFWKQRLICKAGTAGLFVMNAAWLGSLVYKSTANALKSKIS